MKYQLKALLVMAVCSGMLQGCGSSNSSNVGSSSPLSMPPKAGTPTGIPDEDSFTLAQKSLSVEGMDYDGITNTVTAYVADRHNYAVADGTVVYFMTDAGAFQTKSCSTTNGQCSVTWSSQQPKPADGKVRITAWTRGEESFTDLNGNDAYDAGEPFTDIGEPFLDVNGNGTYDAGVDLFIDENNNQTYDGPSGVYTGTSCATPCDHRELDVWTTTVFTESGSYQGTTTATSSPSPISVSSTGSVDFTVTDEYGNPLPDGTIIAISASDGTLATTGFTVHNGATNFVSSYTASATAGTVTFTVVTTTPLTVTDTRYPSITVQ